MATPRYPTEAYEENPDLEFSPQAGAFAEAPTSAGIVTGASPPEPPPPPPPPAPSFQAAPTTGLPLGPRPGLQPGFQLGGQAPDITPLLLAQLMAPQQRQWSTGETIGNAIQAAGAGLLGQTPAWMQQEAMEQDRRTKQVGQLLQVSEMQQRQQDRQQNAMIKAAELGIKFGELMPEDQDRQRGQFQALTRSILQSASVPGFDDIVQEAYQPGKDEYRADLVTPFTDPAISPERRAQYVQSLRRVKGEKDRHALTKDFIAQEVEEQAHEIQGQLPTLAAEYRAEQRLPEDAVIEQGQLEAFIRRKHPDLAQSRIMLKAWDTVTASKTWPQTAVGMGVNPSSVKLKAAEKAAELEVEGPKFPHLDPYKPLVPYMTDVSGLTALQLDRIAGTDPNRFAAIVQEAQKRAKADQLQRARELGAVKALTPEKASPAEREKLTSDVVNMQLATDMQNKYKPAFVGPITGRVGVLRSDWTGAMSEEEAQFRQSVTHFNNALIKELGGVVVPPAEFERIMAERPHLNLPPVTFEARMRQSRDNLIFMGYVRRAQMEKTGVDTSQLPPLPPLPKRFEGHPSIFGKTAPTPATEPTSPATPPKPPTATAPPPVKRSGTATRVR